MECALGRPEKIRLGEILVQQQLLTEAQLTAALAEQKKNGRRLGRILIERGLANEEQIAEALARQLNAPYVNLKFYNLNTQLIRKLSEAQARRYRALVLDESGGRLKVGMAEPTDLMAYDDLSRILQRDIELNVISEGELLRAIDRVYRRTEEISGLAQELKAELSDSVVDFEALAVSPGLEEAPVVKLLQTVFEDAVQARASDIHIEPHEDRLLIRFRIDGVLHVQTKADPKIAPAVVLRLKLMSELDIAEKRLPQDGRFNVKVRKAHVDVRISTMPTQYGESVVMRLLHQGGGVLGLDKIGMPPGMLGKLREIIQRPSGMVLVTGPTGSGKTTTLYAALSELNTSERKVITVEDPVEYRLPGINQVQVNEKIELTFERVLRSALRQDPDVVLVGEMRDRPTVETGLRAALTGHMVFSTLHTNDAISTPIRLFDMGAPRYMVAFSLQLVLAQRLVRVICESCAEPGTLLPHEHAWLAAELSGKMDGHSYKRGKGCSHCNGTGFLGRTGVYEMLEMTRPVVEAIDREDPGYFIAAAREQIGGETLSWQAARLVAEGRTTASEAMRVSSQTEE